MAQLPRSNASSNVVTVKTTTGETIDLTITPHSFILHLPLGETDRTKAAKLAIGDLSAGEELVASYQLSSDGKVKEARTIYVRTKADLEEMAKKDDDDWRKRGTTGNLSAINPAAKTFTIKSRLQRNRRQAGRKTNSLRYSPDSAKSTDAKPSSLPSSKTRRRSSRAWQ